MDSLKLPEFILVNTQIPENLGASARVMFNFGQKKLNIVSPAFDLKNEKILPLAAGADEIIHNIKNYNTLQKAIEKLNIVIGTTNRIRSIKKKQISFTNLNKLLTDNKNNIGIIFGPEKSGLNNDDISMCDFILKINTNNRFSSLNLSHAVAVVSYEMMKAKEMKTKRSLKKSFQVDKLASKKELLNFYYILENNLKETSFFTVKEREKILKQKIRNIFNKLQLTSNDLQTLLGILKSLRKTSKK